MIPSLLEIIGHFLSASANVQWYLKGILTWFAHVIESRCGTGLASEGHVEVCVARLSWLSGYLPLLFAKIRS